MKDKQKSLEDLDFLTELTPSEQEQINGGNSPTDFKTPPLDPDPDPDPVPKIPRFGSSWPGRSPYLPSQS